MQIQGTASFEATPFYIPEGLLHVFDARLFVGSLSFQHDLQL